MRINNFEKVSCPKCGRTISHYIKGYDSIYRNTCHKCKAIVIIYSAGKTVEMIETETKINIKF